MLLGFSLSQLDVFVQCTNCSTVHDCTLSQETGPSFCPLTGKFSEELGLEQGLKEIALSLGHDIQEEGRLFILWGKL